MVQSAQPWVRDDQRWGVHFLNQVSHEKTALQWYHQTSGTLNQHNVFTCFNNFKGLPYFLQVNLVFCRFGRLMG